MRSIEIAKAEQIREEVRKVINKMIDEEYDSLMKDLEENEKRLNSRDIIQILENIISGNDNNENEEPGIEN